MVDDRNRSIIDLVINGFNKFRRPAAEVQDDLKKLQDTNKQLNREIGDNQSRLRMIEDFRRLTPEVKKLSDQLVDQRAEFDQYNQSLRGVSNRTEAQSRHLVTLRERIRGTNRELSTYRRQLDGVTEDLRKAGIAEEKFDEAIEETTRELREQNRALEANEAALRRNESAQRRFQSDQDKSTASIKSTIIAISRARSALLSVGIAIAGAVGIGRVAEEFGDVEEAALAVQKVTTLTAGEIELLTRELQTLSNTIGVSTTPELLNLAAAGGRLGVDGVQNVLSFTRVMDQLTSATNLAGEEGAESFGRLINATDTTGENFQNLASALVEVGNNTAATEALIARFATRIANVTKEAGFSRATSIALAGSLAEIGVQAEAGGTQIGLVTRRLREFIQAGGEQLQQVSEITDQTADQLRQALADGRLEDVLIDFISGLGKLSTGAGEATRELNKLGLTNERTLLIIPAIAERYERLQANVARANNAFNEGNALAEEAARSYAAQNSIVDRLVNTTKNLGVTFGEAFSTNFIELINRITGTMGENRNVVSQLGDVIGGMVNEIASGASALVEFARETQFLNGLQVVVGILRTAFISLAAGINTVTGAIQLLQVGYNELFGTQEAVDEAYTRFEATLKRVERNSKELFTVVESAIGETSQAYEDFLSIIEENAGAIESLEDEEDRLIATRLKGIAFSEDFRSEYIRLTNEIRRQVEVQRIAGELQKESDSGIATRIDRLRAVGEEQSTINRIILEGINAQVQQTQVQSQINALADQATESLKGETRSLEQLKQETEDTTKSSEELAEVFGLIRLRLIEQRRGIEETEELTKSLSDATKEFSESILDSTFSQQQNTDSLGQLRTRLQTVKDEYANGQITLREFQAASQSLETTIRAVTGAVDEEKLSVQELIATYSKAVASRLEYLEAQVQGVRGDESARVAANQLSTEIQGLERSWAAGSITLQEYNARKDELERISRILTGTIEVESEFVNRYSGITDRATVATQTSAIAVAQLGDQYAQLGVSVTSTESVLDASATRQLERNERLTRSYAELGRAQSQLTGAGQLSGEIDREGLDDAQQRALAELESRPNFSSQFQTNSFVALQNRIQFNQRRREDILNNGGRPDSGEFSLSSALTDRNRGRSFANFDFDEQLERIEERIDDIKTVDELEQGIEDINEIVDQNEKAVESGAITTSEFIAINKRAEKALKELDDAFNRNAEEQEKNNAREKTAIEIREEQIQQYVDLVAGERQARIASGDLQKQLEEVEQQWKRNTITVKEYLAIRNALISGIDRLEDDILPDRQLAEERAEQLEEEQKRLKNAPTDLERRLAAIESQSGLATFSNAEDIIADLQEQRDQNRESFRDSDITADEFGEVDSALSRALRELGDILNPDDDDDDQTQQEESLEESDAQAREFEESRRTEAGVRVVRLVLNVDGRDEAVEIKVQEEADADAIERIARMMEQRLND